MIHIGTNSQGWHFDNKENALAWLPSEFPLYVVGDDCNPITVNDASELRRAIADAEQNEYGARVRSTLEELQTGRRVVSTEMMNAIEAFSYVEQNPSDVRTCRNRKRVGRLDEMVAWINNPPNDLEFKDGYAIGSA